MQHGKAEGTIEHAGTTYKFTGYGVHERIIQSGIVPDRTRFMGNRGLGWIQSWGEKLSFYVMKGDVGENAATGILYVGDECYAVEAEKIHVEETLYWLDPKSKINIPYRWKVVFETPAGRLQAEVYAYGRGYYTWLRRHGTMVVNQYTADAAVKLTQKDGTVLEEKHQSMVEHMRTLYRQPEQR